MAGPLNLRKGTRLQLAFDCGYDKQPDFNMFCTFNKNVDDVSILVSVPMREGKPLILDENQKLLFQCGEGQNILFFAGYADLEVKEGIRRYWKIRRVNEQRKFIKRADERIKAALRILYKQSTWEPEDDGTIKGLDAMTIDISAGGIAMYLNRHFDVGEFLEIDFPRMGMDPEGAVIKDVIGVVCWNREAPKGSLYRHVCGIQFRFADGADRERMQDYVAYIKKKFKL